jgi:hypothetical protein
LKLIFSYDFRRRSSAPSTIGKKNTPTTTNNTTSKSPDKAPLIENTNNTSTAATKRKLVPERTVQISDATTAKFKSNEPTGVKTSSTKPEASAPKPALTAADSGIYGADLSEDVKLASKTAPDPPKTTTTTTTVPAVSEPLTTVVVNPVSEPIPAVVANALRKNSTISAIVVPNNVEIRSSSTIEKEPPLDSTIQSAYTSLIDATASENEGTTCGSGLQSRRTSNIKQTLLIQESNNIETVVISEYTDSSSHHTIPFNPLHVILKKDANKYYTTEYI